MGDYPTLAYADSGADPAAELASANETEIIRASIAQNQGLETLTIIDQIIRAMTELGVHGETEAASVGRQIDNALVAFKFRGFPTGAAPTPAKIRKAIKRIADSAKTIESELNMIMSARRGAGGKDEPRALALAQIQHLILGSIADNALPAPLRAKFTDDDIADVMPSASLLTFNNQWNGGFERIGLAAQKVHDAFPASELKNPPRVVDPSFADFIGRLGAIYQDVTGQAPHAPDRNANQPDGWRGPFSRFVEAVWPLTPEGSGGLGSNRRCPSNRKIRDALDKSAVLTSQSAS